MKKSKFLAALCAAVMTAGMAGAFSGVQAADETLRIMELGDSITDGFNVTGGYRIPLWYLLHDAGYIDSYHMDFVGPNGWYIDGVCDTDHAGYSGYSIDDIPNQRTGLYSFIDWLMQEYPADIVMLQIGTNDILSSSALDTAENRLELLVDTILTYIPEDGMLFLATIPDMAADVTTYTDAYTVEEMDAAVAAYNAAVLRVAQRKQSEGKPVMVSDNHAALTKSDLADGVHPSEDGYRKLAEHWYTVLTNYLDGTEPAGTTETTTETTTAETAATAETTTTAAEITTTSETAATDAPAPLLGDIVTDQKLDLKDVIALQKHLVGLEPMSYESRQLADMNADGRADIFDLALLKHRVFEEHTGG